MPETKKRTKKTKGGSKKSKDEMDIVASALDNAIRACSEPSTVEVQVIDQGQQQPPPPPLQEQNATIQAQPMVSDVTLPAYEEEIDDSFLATNLFEDCPYHAGQWLECINPGSEWGSSLYKCGVKGCPVFVVGKTQEVVLDKLRTNTHPQLRALLQAAKVRCPCKLVPRMRLSKTEKELSKSFLNLS